MAIIRALAKHKFIYAAWAMKRYTAHCTAGKKLPGAARYWTCALSHLGMAHKARVHLLSAIHLPNHLLLALVVPINGSNVDLFRIQYRSPFWSELNANPRI